MCNENKRNEKFNYRNIYVRYGVIPIDSSSSFIPPVEKTVNRWMSGLNENGSLITSEIQCVCPQW